MRLGDSFISVFEKAAATLSRGTVQPATATVKMGPPGTTSTGTVTPASAPTSNTLSRGNVTPSTATVRAGAPGTTTTGTVQQAVVPKRVVTSAGTSGSTGYTGGESSGYGRPGV